MLTMKKMRTILAAAGLPVLSLLGLVACTQYHTPGGPADLAALGLNPDHAGTPDRFRLPVSAMIAVVRVQAPDYSSMTGMTGTTRNPPGTGVVTTILEPDSEDSADLVKLSKMYAVRGSVGLNRIVLPSTVSNLDDLESAAKAAGADTMFIYTLDTRFFDPQNVAYGDRLKLGFGNSSSHVDSLASGAFVDLKSRLIFGQVQAAASTRLTGDDLSSTSVIDHARIGAERQAFKDLAAQAESRWQVAQERALR